MAIFFVFLIVVGLVAIQFLSRRLSPVPYFPTNRQDIPLVVQALSLKNGQLVVDLGAGDGIVIFAAAQKAYETGLTTSFVAVENNIALVLFLHLRRLFHSNRGNISILMANMFTMDYSKLSTLNSQFSTFYLYVSPWLIEKLVARLKHMKKPISIVSYFYPIRSIKERTKIQGVHPIFVYRLPPAPRRG